MHCLSSLIPALALAASVNARVISQPNIRRNMMAAPMGGDSSAAVMACGDPAAASMAASTAAATAATAPSGGTTAAGAGAKAIYFMTNQDDNSVIMIPVQEDGTLKDGSIIATGGKGGVLIDAMTGQPAPSDTLASQGSVRVIGSSLFAVNAGSNSLSMFAIDPQDPAKLAAVGQAVETGGDVCLSCPFNPNLPSETDLKLLTVPNIRRGL
jgi:hypothetical protein